MTETLIELIETLKDTLSHLEGGLIGAQVLVAIDKGQAALASQKPVAYAIYQVAGDHSGIVLRTVKPWAGDDSFLWDDDGLGDFWAGNRKLFP
jgi:hypothetical protein